MVSSVRVEEKGRGKMRRREGQRHQKRKALGREAAVEGGEAPCRPSWGGGEAWTGGKMEGPAGRGEEGETEVRARGWRIIGGTVFFFSSLKKKSRGGWGAVSARTSDGGLQLCVSMQGAGGPG